MQPSRCRNNRQAAGRLLSTPLRAAPPRSQALWPPYRTVWAVALRLHAIKEPRTESSVPVAASASAGGGGALWLVTSDTSLDTACGSAGWGQGGSGGRGGKGSAWRGDSHLGGCPWLSGICPSMRCPVQGWCRGRLRGPAGQLARPRLVDPSYSQLLNSPTPFLLTRRPRSLRRQQGQNGEPAPRSGLEGGPPAALQACPELGGEQAPQPACSWPASRPLDVLHKPYST